MINSFFCFILYSLDNFALEYFHNLKKKNKKFLVVSEIKKKKNNNTRLAWLKF